MRGGHAGMIRVEEVRGRERGRQDNRGEGGEFQVTGER